MTVSAIHQASGAIQSAIALASRATGINFDYLLGQAKLESGLNPNAKASTSSAGGLYQFLDQSWLAVLKRHGAEHGYGWAADAISGSGRGLTVGDPATRQAIMQLRSDPQASSLMAAEYASDNKDGLQAALGRPVNSTDLYMAHFLGLGGARQFLSTMASNPGATAAGLFPAAARANHNLFYGRDGSANSLQQIYDGFTRRLASVSGGAAPGATDAAAPTALATAAQAIGLGGDATVVTGGGESAGDALAWARSTLGQLQTANANVASVLRPTPDTARLAYLMLASLGG